MRGIAIWLWRECRWPVALLVHASVISLVWNVLVCTHAINYKAMAPWEPVGIALIIGLIGTRPAKGGKAIAIRIALSYLCMGSAIILECINWHFWC